MGADPPLLGRDMLAWADLSEQGDERSENEEAPTNHEFDMLLILLLWISLVLGVAVGSIWLRTIVQKMHVRRLRVPQIRVCRKHGRVNRLQKRYDWGPMPQLYWHGSAARTSLPPRIPDA